MHLPPIDDASALAESYPENTVKQGPAFLSLARLAIEVLEENEVKCKEEKWQAKEDPDTMSQFSSSLNDCLTGAT